ncbi:Uncharacterised protein [Vibrio cholerae]|nr:Uncharacterised protein [Vibrio cholerae]
MFQLQHYPLRQQRYGQQNGSLLLRLGHQIGLCKPACCQHGLLQQFFLRLCYRGKT